jgi:DnaJ-class molecular chaperone
MVEQGTFFCPACGGSGSVRGAYQKGHHMEDYYMDCPQCNGVGHLCVHTLAATPIEHKRPAARRSAVHAA